MHPNRLFVEPTDGGWTAKQLGRFLENDEVFVKRTPIIGGGFADVVELTEVQLIEIIYAKFEANLNYNVYEKSADNYKLRPIIVNVNNHQLTVLQVLNRRIKNKLVKIKSAQGAQVSVEPAS